MSEKVCNCCRNRFLIKLCLLQKRQTFLSEIYKKVSGINLSENKLSKIFLSEIFWCKCNQCIQDNMMNVKNCVSVFVNVKDKTLLHTYKFWNSSCLYTVISINFLHKSFAKKVLQLVWAVTQPYKKVYPSHYFWVN